MKGGEKTAKEYAEWFYKSKEWRETRKAFLDSKLGLCEKCGEVANVVHHINYITPKNIHNPYITLNHNNLMALCKDCHNTIHKAKTEKKERRYNVNELGEVAQK